MNLGAIRIRLAERLDDQNGVYYTSVEMNSAINEAQRLFVLLTLCLEKTASFSLVAGTTFYTDLRASLTDYLLPLRVNISNVRVRPANFSELDYLNSAWEAATGVPTAYVTRGFNALAIYPHPSGSGTSLSITYAYEPAVLTSDSDIPEIPLEHHPDLIDCAVYLCRLKEGGQEFQKGLAFYGRFLDTCSKYATFIRARSVAQGYDRLPFDLARHDISRQLKIQQLPRVPVPVIRKDAA